MTQTPMQKAVEAAHAVLESYWTTGPEVVEEALTAALSALEAEGFVVAPVEPTKEMHDAGAERETWIGIYQAMLEARPSASALCRERPAPSAGGDPDGPAPLPPVSSA